MEFVQTKQKQKGIVVSFTQKNRIDDDATETFGMWQWLFSLTLLKCTKTQRHTRESTFSFNDSESNCQSINCREKTFSHNTINDFPLKRWNLGFGENIKQLWNCQLEHLEQTWLRDQQQLGHEAGNCSFLSEVLCVCFMCHMSHHIHFWSACSDVMTQAIITIWHCNQICIVVKVFLTILCCCWHPNCQCKDTVLFIIICTGAKNIRHWVRLVLIDSNRLWNDLEGFDGIHTSNQHLKWRRTTTKMTCSCASCSFSWQPCVLHWALWHWFSHQLKWNIRLH